MVTLLLSFASATPPPDHLLVSSLHRSGTKACPQGAHDITFYDVGLNAGWTPVHAPGFDPTEHLGRVAVLRGAPGSLPSRPSDIPAGYSLEHCPIPQLRSDMVETPDGIRHDRGLRPEIPGFLASKVEPYTGLKVTKEGEAMVFRFENTTQRTMNDLVLTAHYEGCFGKPGAKQNASEAIVLEAGKSTTFRVPPHLTTATSAPPRKGAKGNNRGTFRLDALSVSGKGNNLWVAIDTRLSSLSVEVAPCPR